MKARFQRLAAPALIGILALGCTPPHHPPAAHAPTQAEQQAASPEEVRQRLAAGNQRYITGQPRRHDWAQARSETAQGQFPYAVVLSCVDSRTSAEIVFDQGLGEIFNARVAGNVLNDDILGSMEFACKVAGAKLIAVIGHTECGAVNATCTGVKLGHLTGLLDRIRPALGKAATCGQPPRINDVAEANVRLVMKQIGERSEVLRTLIDSGKVGVAGGIYDVRSGTVKFLNP